jgi:patatin-like phospholipase/acyl hydrolase
MLVYAILIDHRGGMRGIIELESLKAIEKVLGEGLPIQSFFDLIVGTR